MLHYWYQGLWNAADIVGINLTVVCATKPPGATQRTLRFLCSWFWPVLLVVPFTVIEIGGHELSAIPWQAFQVDYFKHGFTHAALLTANVLISEAWVLWIPGHLYIFYHCRADKSKAVLIRLLNLALGLLLLTPGNPLCWLFMHLGSQGAVDTPYGG